MKREGELGPIEREILSRKGGEYETIKDWYTMFDWTFVLEKSELVIKSNENAEMVKSIGNFAYQSRDFEGAMHTYTRALGMANQGSAVYGTLLSNISSCLYEINMFEKCIIYIDACFTTLFPKMLRPKVYVRKIKAFCKLGQTSLAAETTLEMKNFVSKCKISPQEKENYFKLAEQALVETKMSESGILVKYLSFELKENPTISNITANATLKYTKQNRPYFLAQARIKKGECILLEKPYATFGLLKCPYCFKNFNCIVSCNNCTQIVYCSIQCREQDKTLHRWECKFYQYKFVTNEYFVIPNISLRAFLKGLQTDFNSYVYQMNRNFCDIPESKKVYYLDMSCVLLAYIKSDKKLKQWIERKLGNDFYSIGKQLLHLIINCDLNIKMTIKHVNFAAHLLIPSLSLFNHSCLPNTSLHIQQDTTVVRALKDISKGEQIYLNYVKNEMGAMSAKSRQNALLDRFLFTCQCPLCTTDVGKLGLMRCPTCKLYADILQTNLLKCESCGMLKTLNADQSMMLMSITGSISKDKFSDDVNILCDRIRLANSMDINPKSIVMTQLFSIYVIECAVLGTLDKSVNCLQHIQEIQYSSIAFSLNLEIFWAIYRLVRTCCSSSERYVPKYNKTTLAAYEGYLKFLHEFFFLHSPIEFITTNLPKLEMFFSIHRQILEFKKSVDWSQ